MCEGDGCDGCTCDGCDALFFACLCCCYNEPVVHTGADPKPKEKKEPPAPPLVMLRTEKNNGYQTL